MDLEDLSCAICQELFETGERVPRMLQCGHTYCQRCLIEIFQRPPLLCPEDRTPITVRSAEELPKNFALIKVIMKTHEFIPQIDNSMKCAEHKKKLEYICLDDRAKVCANCALFGRHKGHDVRAEEELMREITIRAECLFEMMQIVENSQMTVLNEKTKARVEDLYETYHHRKNELELELRRCFADARGKLFDMEKTAELTLQKNFDNIEDNFASLRELPRLIDVQSSTWIQGARERLDHISSLAEDSNYIAFEVLESGDLLQIGEKVLTELEGLKKLPINQLEEAIQGVGLEFAETLLSGLVKVHSRTKHSHPKQTAELKTTLNPEVPKVDHPGEDHFWKPGAKKPINEKIFEEAMDALRLHTDEVADFSGAGGTSHSDISERVESVASLLTSNFCLKTLKFVKNGIPDAIVIQICAALQENTTLQSLHIAQNPMTAEAMSAVINLLGLNTTLRDVNLMGNPKMTPEFKQKFSSLSNKFRKIYT